jgi:hypothetical protein
VKIQADILYDADYLIGLYDSNFHTRYMASGPCATAFAWLVLFFASFIGSALATGSLLKLSLLLISPFAWVMFYDNIKRSFGVPARRRKSPNTSGFGNGPDEPILHRQSQRLYAHLLVMGYTSVDELCRLREAIYAYSPERRNPMSQGGLVIAALVLSLTFAGIQEAIVLKVPNKQLPVYTFAVLLALLTGTIFSIWRQSGYGNKLRRMLAMLDYLLLDLNVRLPADGMHPQYPDPPAPIAGIIDYVKMDALQVPQFTTRASSTAPMSGG